jgi:thiamine-phosphate pyrophosphorylase
MRPHSSPRAGPILCYVTDRHSLPIHSSNEPLLQKIERAAQAGVDWIQLREKDLSARACATLTREALLRMQSAFSRLSSPSRILVNDRLDVALAEGAGGVHLGESSLPVEEAKRLLWEFSRTRSLPEGFLAGVSCHSLESAISAANSGADYLFFGPVFATPSKAAFGAPQGLERLAAVCRAVGVPVLAIGGITLQNAAACFEAGASGIAAIRLFQDAAEEEKIVQSIRAGYRANSF